METLCIVNNLDVAKKISISGGGLTPFFILGEGAAPDGAGQFLIFRGAKHFSAKHFSGGVGTPKDTMGKVYCMTGREIG